jgi:hypothetical protein
MDAKGFYNLMAVPFAARTALKGGIKKPLDRNLTPLLVLRGLGGFGDNSAGTKNSIRWKNQ